MKGKGGNKTVKKNDDPEKYKKDKKKKKGKQVISGKAIMEWNKEK